MNKLYYENILSETITLSSNMLGSNLDLIILEELKKKIGNKCIKEGYVDSDSIDIIKRTIGKLDNIKVEE